MSEAWLCDAESYIDRNFDRFVSEISGLCRFPNVSALGADHRPCADSVVRHMETLGIKTSIHPLGGERNPPLIYGRYDVPSAQRTMMMYGHYDVQPVDPLDLWHTDPFEPVVKDGFLYGRGAHDDKGQFFVMLKALEILQAIGRAPGVNLVFIIDPEEEIGSPLLEPFVRSHPELFDFVDFGCSIDGEMMEDGRVPMIFGNRGNCHLSIRIRTANTDAHSGMWGGVMPNAAWRMIAFLNTLKDDTGRIQIDGFYDDVVPPSESDIAAAKALEFDETSIKARFDVRELRKSDSRSYWEAIMFHPTCEISGFAAGQTEAASKSIIAGEARVQIDLRLVPAQTPRDIREKFRAHAVKHGFDDLEIIDEGMMYTPGRAPLDHPLRAIAEPTILEVFGKAPAIFPSAGGSNPGAVWNEVAHFPFMEVPCGQAGSNAHAPNERLDLGVLRKGLSLYTRLYARIR